MEFRDALAAYLATQDADLELAPGLTVKVRQMSLKERLSWRARILDDKGELKPSWELELLAACVLAPDGSPAWASADAIDGSELAIRPILELALQVNGLAQGQAKDDEGN